MDVRQFGARSFLQACAACIILAAGMRNAVASPVEYDIDQRYATIRFQTGFAGLLHPEGSFPRFQAHLRIDFARPGASEIEVIVDDRAIEMSSSAEADTLRSSAYFNSAEHPTITFRSIQIRSGSPGHFSIDGLLTIRGVERPETLDATLLETTDTEPAVAQFALKGNISRAEFGMVANKVLVSDRIALAIQATLTLPRGTPLLRPRPEPFRGNIGAE